MPRAVHRKEVVQACLDLFPAPRYLEIGVWKGLTFLPLQASVKIAVDPKFAFDYAIEAQNQDNCSFYEMSSDEFFGQIDISNKFDVVYLDGLHTFEQTLRDLMNSIGVSHDRTIIVVDDVFPPYYHSSLRNQKAAIHLGRMTGSNSSEWMGDVYKLTLFIDTFLQQYSYGMVSNNHGQLIIWKKPRPTVPSRTVDEVARWSFENMHFDKDKLNRAPLNQIVARVQADFGIGSMDVTTVDRAAELMTAMTDDPN